MIDLQHDFKVVDTSDTELDTMKNKDECDNQPKFRLRMMPREFNWGTYLNQNRITASIFIDDYENNDYKQTIFNESEYNRIRNNCPDWLPEFNKYDKRFELVEDK